MKKNDPWRAYLLGYLRRGEISLADAAFIAGVTPQAVWGWCVDAGIKIKEARHARLVKLRAQGQRSIARTHGVDVAVGRGWQDKQNGRIS